MGEFGRILTNLGLAYGLMSKEQFVEKVAQYAHEKDMSEDKMMALVESLFEELEITHKRRQARQMFEAHRMKQQAKGKTEADFYNSFDTEDFQPESAKKNTDKIDALFEEMRSLRMAVEELTQALQNKNQ